jgi:hypothetical protein
MSAAIETTDLAKTYAGGVRALGDLDLRVELAEVFGYLWLIGTAPLQNGVDGWGVLAVVAAAVAVVGGGSLLVERRDLETP